MQMIRDGRLPTSEGMTMETAYMYNLKCNILLWINLYINKIAYFLVLWSSLYLYIFVVTIYYQKNK